MSDLDIWVVIEYEQAEITPFGARRKVFAPGAPSLATLTSARGEQEAITNVADHEGKFAAFPLPDLEPMTMKLELHEE